MHPPRFVFTASLLFSCLLALAPVQGQQATSSGRSTPTADEVIVFSALDLQRPELAAVAKAVAAKDYAAASHAWADYLRKRPGFYWGGKDAPPPKCNLQVAEDASNGKIQGGSVPVVYAFPDGKIDWFFNATKKPGQTTNNEWQWQINRMAFWADMGAAYVITHDERYPKAFAQQLHSWIAQCPVPDHADNNVGSAWRTIDTGIRLGFMWPAAFFRMLPSPSLTDDDIVAYTRSVFEQARYLRQHQTSVNWVLMEMNGLVEVGCFFPEFRDAAEWRAFAFARLDAEAKQQLLPDGSQYELSSGYHDDVVIPNFLAARNVALWTGHDSDVPADYVAALEKAYDWSMYLSTPDRNRPLVNDAWPGRIGITLRAAAQLFPDRADFQWFVTDGKEGRPPPKTSVFLDWSGLAVMRSGWEGDANYLLFNDGPLGYGGLMGMGHSHQAKLNVVIWAYGRQILFNGSGSSYTWDKWRVWSRSSLSQNCIAVDGLGQNRGETHADPTQAQKPDRVSQQPIDASWKTGPVFDFASGVYDEEYGTSEYGVPGMYDAKLGPQKRRIATQRRSVLFVKPDIYIVADTMTPLDTASHSYQARWQLLTTQTALDAKSEALATTDPGVPNLAIIPLLTDGLQVRSASAQETPEILGWNCRKDMVPQNIPTTTVLQTRQGTGVQHFLTLFLPLKAGETNPVTSLSTEGTGVKVHLADGRSFAISASDAGGIAFQETGPDGKPGRAATTTLP